MATGARGVPRTVRDTVRLARSDDALRRILLLSLACGLALGTLELLGPTLFADLSGSATGGSAVFGVVMAVSFLAGAAGSALAPRVTRLARWPPAPAATSPRSARNCARTRARSTPYARRRWTSGTGSTGSSGPCRRASPW